MPEKAKQKVKVSQIKNIVVRKMRDYTNETAVLAAKFRKMSAEEIQGELTKEIQARIRVRREKLEQTTFIRAKLLHSLTEGIISKEDYHWMKNSYSDSLSGLEKEIENLLLDVEIIRNHYYDRMLWMENTYICAPASSIDRELTAQLINRISIFKNNIIKMDFVFAGQQRKLGYRILFSGQYKRIVL